MSEWLYKARLSFRGILEVVLVAFFLFIVSRYWPVSEHVVYLSFFAATALIALSRGFEGTFSIRRFIPLIAYGLFTGWVVLSSTWAPSFHLSLGRALTVGLVGAIGVAIGFALTSRTVAKGLILGAVLHVGHAVFADDLGILGFVALGEKPGLFTNYADMTFVLGIGILSALSMMTSRSFFAFLCLPILVFFLITSVGIAVLTMFFAVVSALFVGLMLLHLRYSSHRKRKVWAVVYPIVVVFGIVSFWLLREPILRPFGQGPDLSGRTIIWGWFWEAFLWEPLIGIGWGTSYQLPVRQGETFPTGQYFIAHNGYLDIGLVTGAVGVALIIVTLAAVFLRGSNLVLDRANSLSYLLIPTLLTYIVVNDIMATSLPRYIGMFLLGALVGLLVSQPSRFDLRDTSESSEKKDYLLPT